MNVPARENPFEVSRVESLIKFNPKWVGTDWETLVERFQEQDLSAIVTGPHGSGKTTFLRDFEPILTAKTELVVCPLFLNAEKRCLSPQEKVFLTNCPNHESIVIFLDGEEQMSFVDRLEFKRIAHGFAGLLTTRHSPKRRDSILMETVTSPEMLQQFLETLMPDFPNAEAASKNLYTEANGNIRDALRKAYDVVASDRFPDSTESSH